MIKQVIYIKEREQCIIGALFHLYQKGNTQMTVQATGIKTGQ